MEEHFNMCLLMSLDRVLEYGEVLNVPQADERNRVVTRKEVMLFNIDAYREAVINAFLHNQWVTGNEPMFTAYEDRIEILSRGTLPPDQTMEGFYLGESVPVNKKLSDIFVQLHISEKSGRGVPKIVEKYGEKAFDFRENSIVVTIPYNRLDLGNNTQDSTQVTTQVATQVSESKPNAGNIMQGLDPTSQKIIEFCSTPKTTKEITDYLGFRERKSASKYIRGLVNQGRLAMTIPDKPNSSKQKYISIR